MKPKIVLLLVPLLLIGLLRAGEVTWPASAAIRYESGRSAASLQQLDTWIRETQDDPGTQARLEQVLNAMLAPESTLEAKLFACQRLAIVGTEASLPALARLLRSETTVGMACLALANYPTTKADGVLRKALRELEGVSRLQVIATLGNRRDPGASRALSRIARGTDTAAAAAATLALGRIADRTARRTLAELRRDTAAAPHPAIDEASLLEAEALAAAGDCAEAVARYEALILPHHPDPVRAGALDALLRLEPGRAEARIHALLREEDSALMPDTALRPVAIAGVGRLRSSTSGLVFAGELERLPLSERCLLVEALADLGANCPRAALATQLNSASAELRLAVIHAFARLNAPEDVAVFVRALEVAQTPAERQTVEDALVQLAGGSATEAFLLSQQAKAPPEVRQGLLNALGRRGTGTAIPALFEAAGSPDAGLARSGFQGLGRLAGPAELPALLDLYVTLPAGLVRDDAEGALARILGRMPDAAGRGQAVRAKLEAATTLPARVALTRLLPMAGGLDALAAVRAAVSAEDALLRDAAVRALAQWTDESAVADLLVVFEGTDQQAHRTLALRALTRLATEANSHPSEALVGRYREMLSLARTDEERRMILGALGGCALPQALDLALAQRESAGVRAEAEQAVRRITEAIKGSHPEAAAAALAALAAG